ncbi:MAG: hypothetical protein IJW38_04910 [Clostridia bacterium]|nr:hypothetical protein [Clostridia bacterium]
MQNEIKSYYAAANGYSGFRSYFNEVFNTQKLERLFIIKGGPGTGKSTLMKKILKDFSSKGYPCDAIYCSSDPNSLDGVIINGEIAVIDGTAPHQTDTKLPGAVDEILNLGEGWSYEKLKKRRKEIEEINKRKKQNYDSAYKYLSFSGNMQNYKIELLKKQFDFKSAENVILSLISNYKNCETEAGSILISAFCKNGYSRRSLSGFDIKKTYSLKGEFGEEKIFLELLSKLALGKYSLTRFPSPFADEITEGLYFEDEKILFLENCEGEEVIACSRFIKEKENAELDFLDNITDLCLEKSKEAFIKASEAHFLLEDIYKDSMDFKINEEIYESLSEKVSKILTDKR